MCILIRSQRGDFVIMFILIGCAIIALITSAPTLYWTMAVCGVGGLVAAMLNPLPSTRIHLLYLQNIIPEVASLMSFPCPGLD